MPQPNAGSARRFNPLALLTLILLLPACALCSFASFYPMVETFQASTERNRGFTTDDSENVGVENYERLQEEFADTGGERGRGSIAREALEFTIPQTGYRVFIFATVPLILGILLGMQGWVFRGCNRVLLSVVLACAVPIVLALLWSVFFGRTWDFDGFDPSPLEEAFDPIPDELSFRTPEGARNLVYGLDAMVTLALAVGLGSLFFAGAVRGGRLEDIGSSSPWLATIAAWIIAIVAGFSAWGFNFTIPWTLTGGGPGISTTNLHLLLWRETFQQFDLGYGAAMGVVLYLVPAVLLGAIVWFVMTAFNLRLRFAEIGRASCRERV